MTKLRSRLVLAGVVTLIVGVVATFPARVAYRWFAPPALELGGISGSIWTGRAAGARAVGMSLRDLEWRFRPLNLFAGRLAYDVAAVPDNGFVDATAGLSFGGAVELRNLQASVSLGALESVVGMPGLRGNVSLQFDRVTLQNGVPVAADGIAEVAGLTAPLIDRGPVGGYKVEFFTQDSGVKATVEDTDGIVDLAGTLDLAPDRSYRFTGLIAPKPATPERLRRQMQFLGTPNERGQYELRLEGAL